MFLHFERLGVGRASLVRARLREYYAPAEMFRKPMKNMEREKNICALDGTFTTHENESGL